MSRRIGWGILGTGRIAGVFARELSFSETGQLVAVGSRSTESAERFAAGFSGVRAHGSADSLWHDPEVEAVYISSPHPWHAEHSISALQAGKHVLCEKPLAMNRAEAEAVIKEARRRKRFFMEAFMYRCHPRTHRLTQLVGSGRIGAVRLIEAAFCFAAAFDPASRLFAPELGGGGILDVGCYTMSVARLLAGAAHGRAFENPASVAGAMLPAPTGVDGVATATLRFDSGILAQLVCGVALQRGDGLLVTGTEGSLTVPRFWKPPGPIEIRNGNQLEIDPPSGPEHLYALEADAVARALPGLESPEMSWADSLGNAAALDEWLASSGSSENAG